MNERNQEQEAAIDAAISKLENLLIARRNQQLGGRFVSDHYAPPIRNAVVDAAMEIIAEPHTYTGKPPRVQLHAFSCKCAECVASMEGARAS